MEDVDSEKLRFQRRLAALADARTVWHELETLCRTRPVEDWPVGSQNRLLGNAAAPPLGQPDSVEAEALGYPWGPGPDGKPPMVMTHEEWHRQMECAMHVAYGEGKRNAWRQARWWIAAALLAGAGLAGLVAWLIRG
jgi:hypothetical protein